MTCAANTNYNPHYMPFEYYASTANPHHLPPSSTAAIGTSADQANHQYDLNALNAALAAGNLPAVTFIKAPQTETGHPQKSGPLLEQTFLVNTINALMQSPAWPSMAIFITYDDSDGWYDHVMPPIVNQSNDPNLDHICNVNGTLGTGAFNDRCGYGTRLPFVVISPYAKANYVDHTVTDLTSILGFHRDQLEPRLHRRNHAAVTGRRIVRPPGGLAQRSLRLHGNAQSQEAHAQSEHRTGRELPVAKQFL